MTPLSALEAIFEQDGPLCTTPAEIARVVRDRLVERGFAVLPLEATPPMIQAWRRERGAANGPKRLYEVMISAVKE